MFVVFVNNVIGLLLMLNFLVFVSSVFLFNGLLFLFFVLFFLVVISVVLFVVFGIYLDFLFLIGIGMKCILYVFCFFYYIF